MTRKRNSINRNAEITVGIALLIMTLAAFFAYGYVFSSLIVQSDSVKTVENLVSDKKLFTWGIIGWIVIIIADIVVSWGLYEALKTSDKQKAKIGAGLRLIYTLVLMYSVSKLISVKPLLDGVTKVTTSLESEIMTLINNFESIWFFGLIIFGIHLIVIGYIAIHIKSISKIISILLLVAGFSYFLIHILYGFVPTADTFTKKLEIVLMLPMTIGELGFGLWLSIKGIKPQKSSLVD